jgi:hypothetical protein
MRAQGELKTPHRADGEVSERFCEFDLVCIVDVETCDTFWSVELVWDGIACCSGILGLLVIICGELAFLILRFLVFDLV